MFKYANIRVKHSFVLIVAVSTAVMAKTEAFKRNIKYSSNSHTQAVPWLLFVDVVVDDDVVVVVVAVAVAVAVADAAVAVASEYFLV